MVYGTTWKELIQEEFGDGIMSAIDFDMTLERQPDQKGDRVKFDDVRQVPALQAVLTAGFLRMPMRGLDCVTVLPTGCCLKIRGARQCRRGWDQLLWMDAVDARSIHRGSPEWRPRLPRFGAGWSLSLGDGGEQGWKRRPGVAESKCMNVSINDVNGQ